MSRRLGLWLLGLGAGVALLVSGALASPNGESRRGGTLRLGMGAPPDYVDPALANGLVESWTLLYPTCAKLFNTFPDPDTRRPRVLPEVVRSHTVTDGGRTYTFELKRTFRFHTGAPVIARSFADAFDRNANPLMNSAARVFMRDITGAGAAMQGTATSISGVQVLGRYRLRIRLDRPAGDFPARLTASYFCPILPGTPIRPEGIDLPAGSGPYYIAENVLNERIVLERNPYYRGGRTANPDRILWTIESDWSERLQAFERGETDFTILGFGHPDAVMRDLVRRYGVNRPAGQLLRGTPTRATSNFFFRFNPKRRAFEGARQAPLRKAINYALDRPALTRAHPYLTVRRSDRLLPGALSESRRLYPLAEPDLDTALRFLARAGRRPPTLTLYTWNLAFGLPSAQVFVSNLNEIGIKVKVEALRPRHTRGEAQDAGGAVGRRIAPPGRHRLSRPGCRPHPAPPRNEIRGTDQRNEPGDGRNRPGQGLGRPRGRSHAQRPARGRIRKRDGTAPRLGQLRVLDPGAAVEVRARPRGRLQEVARLILRSGRLETPVRRAVP